MEDVNELRGRLMAEIDGAGDLAALETVRVHALGRKGALTQHMRTLSELAPEQRRSAGEALNAIKDEISEAIERRKERLAGAALDDKIRRERIDVSLPVRPEREGSIHPISQTTDEVIAILGEMGFVVAEGPDIEDDWYNFTALNIPPEHPARQEHDTFYLNDTRDGHRVLLRTQTSPVQVRTMQVQKPPIRIIAPGRTYRCDSDATHSPMFHQVEGLLIDEATHFGHLKGCLIEFCRTFFGVDDLPVRFRPSYFPFTEPSAEVDIGCTREGGQFRIGRGDRWLEILGCGMVNPKVLHNCGIDPDRYQGFAFGMGLERIAMLKYGIPDLRTFFESDLRWLRHYGFSALDMPNLVMGSRP